ncbi:cyanobactin maturation protease PatG family protein [Streptomyces nigra]|uniref:cyanobactin maturation protease PatG family protein n=1 Tax=Streptomyces nigra TaxID=1827580 RepID=UPI00382FD71A
MDEPTVSTTTMPSTGPEHSPESATSNEAVSSLEVSAPGVSLASSADPPPPSHEKSPCGCGRTVPASDVPGRPSEAYPPFVYAVGRLEPRIPSLAIEKEFAQATGRAETANLTDRQALHTVLSDQQSRYLTKHLCYVLVIQGIDTYILRPRDPADYSLLVDAIGPSPQASDLQAVVGLRGPLAPPDFCNGLMLPLVAFDQIYAFDTDSLVAGLPKPDDLDEESFRSASRELFDRVMQIADNAGSSDEHRALNYCAVRYAQIYAKTAHAFASGLALTAIETRPSRLSGSRNIQDVVFSYTHRTTDVTEKHFVRVDVTEEFPFLVTKLSPYYDR